MSVISSFLLWPMVHFVLQRSHPFSYFFSAIYMPDNSASQMVIFSFSLCLPYNADFNCLLLTSSPPSSPPRPKLMFLTSYGKESNGMSSLVMNKLWSFPRKAVQPYSHCRIGLSNCQVTKLSTLWP